MPSKKRSKRSRITLFFLRGLVTLLPVALTVFVFVTVYNFVAAYVTGPINNTIYWTLESNGLGWRALEVMDIDPYNREFFAPDALPLELRELRERRGFDDEEFQLRLFNYRVDNESFFRDLAALGIDTEKLRNKVEKKVPPLIGVALSLALVLWLGWLVTGFFGLRLVGSIDRALHAIPIVRSVYPYSKQVVEFFLSEKELDFDTVVALQYPSRHLWSIGFVTNTALKTIREGTGDNLMAVFVPSSPMPMTGYTVFARAEELIPLPLTIDEALRVTVSGGVLVPPHEFVEGTPREALGLEEAEA